MKTNSAERLLELMTYFGLKQADLCKRTGLPKSAVSMYLSDQRQPRQDKLTIIAEAYGVSEAWLMGYDVPMFENQETDSIEEIGAIIGQLLDSDSDKLEKLIRIFNELDDETRNAYILIGERMLASKRD